MSVSAAFVLRKRSSSSEVEVFSSLTSSQHLSLPTADQVSLFAFDNEFQLGGQSPRAFVLTQENGSRIYGSALTQVYEREPVTGDDAVSLKSALSLVILSEIPAFDAMKKLLLDIFQNETVPNPSTISARAFAIIPAIPYPIPGSAVGVTFQSSMSNSTISTIFSLPSLHEHPTNKCSDEDVILLFRVLPPVAILAAVRALLLEQRIVIHVADGPLESILAPVCEALLSLLYPLNTWPHAYAPLLPSGALLEEILQSPVPVFIGAGSNAFAQLDPSSLEGVVEINLDERTVLIPGEGAYGVNPPPHVTQSWFGSPTVGFRTSTKNQAKLPSLPLRMQKSLLEAISRASSSTLALSTADLLSSLSLHEASSKREAIKPCVAVHVKHECRNWEQRKLSIDSSTFSRSLIQRAFLDAMLLLVGDYDEHMQEITSASSDSRSNGGAITNDYSETTRTAASAAAYLGLHFDRVSALACKREYEPFVSALYGTQVFDDFLSQRLRVSAWTDPSVLFFDALVDTVVTGSPSPFLQGMAVTGERAFVEGAKPMLNVILSGEAQSTSTDEKFRQFTPIDFESAFLSALGNSAPDHKQPLLQVHEESKTSAMCISSPGLQIRDDDGDIPLGGGCFASPQESSAADAVAKVVRHRMSIAGDQIKRERLRSKRISNMHELRIALSPTEVMAPPPPPAPLPPPAPPLPSLRFRLSSWAFKSKVVAAPSTTQDIPALPPNIPIFDALRSPLPASHITAELASPIVNGQSIRKRRRMLHDTTHQAFPPPPPPPPPQPASLTNSSSTIPSDPSFISENEIKEGTDEPLNILHFSNFVSETPALEQEAVVAQAEDVTSSPKTTYIAQLEQRIACLEEALEFANDKIRSLMMMQETDDRTICDENNQPTKRARV